MFIKKLGFILTIILFSLFVFFSCAKKPPAELEQALSFYNQNELKEAQPLFQQVVQKNKDNPDAYAWLAETCRRLGQIDSAVVLAQKAIEIDPCQSFAHTILASAYNPMYGSWEKASQDSTWQHLLKAVECDSTDGNAWLGVWTEAIRLGDWNREKKSLSALIQTGFFTPALLAYNRWMLQHLPDKAILLTSGDMDTYPAVAVQEVENYRPDIVIVNYSLLNTPWYIRYLQAKYKIQIPFSDDELDHLRHYQDEKGRSITIAHQIMKGWLDMRRKGTLGHPIAIAVTVGDLSFAEDTQDHLSLAGAYRLWLPKPAQAAKDTTEIRTSLASIKPADFAGPFVSAQDRSSVRQASSNRMVTNVTELALDYSQLLLEHGRAEEAYQMLIWAERFESQTKLGPVYSEQIAKLKEAAKPKTE